VQNILVLYHVVICADVIMLTTYIFIHQFSYIITYISNIIPSEIISMLRFLLMFTRRNLYCCAIMVIFCLLRSINQIRGSHIFTACNGPRLSQSFTEMCVRTVNIVCLTLEFFSVNTQFTLRKLFLSNHFYLMASNKNVICFILYLLVFTSWDSN
jgi:hypothetical protein